MRAAGGGSGVALTPSPNQIGPQRPLTKTDRLPWRPVFANRPRQDGQGYVSGAFTWGVCSGSRRREAPCGKRLEPMSQEPALGVRPSTKSPDTKNYRPAPGIWQYQKLSVS